MISVSLLLYFFTSKVTADFKCNISNNCRNDTYICKPNENCNINCFGDRVCSDSVFYCPDNFDCIFNVYDDYGLKGSTIKGGNAKKLVIRGRGQNGCERTSIHCPAYGICDISAVDKSCYKCFSRSEIIAQTTTRLLYIHDYGKYVSYILQYSKIYCPTSVNQENKCIIDLQGTGYYKMYQTWIYAQDSFNDVSITCNKKARDKETDTLLRACCGNSYWASCPRMYCGSTNNRTKCVMNITSNSEWVCQDSPSKCDRNEDIENINNICSDQHLGFIDTTYQLSLSKQACLDGITQIISNLIDVIELIYYKNQLFVHSSITQEQRNEFISIEREQFCGNITVQILTCFDEAIDTDILLNLTNSDEFEQDINDNINKDEIVFVYVVNTTIVYNNHQIRHSVNIWIYICIFVCVAICMCLVAIVYVVSVTKKEQKKTMVIQNAMVILMCVAEYDIQTDLQIEKDIHNLSELFGAKNLNYTIYPHMPHFKPKLYWTENEILDLLSKKAEEFDKSTEFDALICVFSGHGMEGNVYTSDDQLIDKKVIHRMFSQNYISSRNKPRLFIFDCCDGYGEYGGLLKQSTVGSINSKKLPYQEIENNEDMADINDINDTKESVKHTTVNDIETKYANPWAYGTNNPDFKLVEINACNSDFQSKCNSNEGSYMVKTFVDKVIEDLNINGKYTQKSLFEIMDEVQHILHSVRKKQLPVTIVNNGTANIIFKKNVMVNDYEIEKQLMNQIGSTNLELCSIETDAKDNVLQVPSPNNRDGHSNLDNIQNRELMPTLIDKSENK